MEAPFSLNGGAVRIQAKNVIAQQLKSTMFHNAPIQLAV
ncbi:protein of unknown function [Acidithiobacillus ferrivorans]|uniref:Uncharacterized protein n=1 Tax=Acidithiobacillus ferrivorans TaxID=160808 RepID=A0A060UPK8_9PROT|nr:hypothetical protein AFERRI_400303 [Acidithiobacillus ferrivorans]SMH64551.1 protein of unknown function [Acidithiobacillus ferrivorans]